MIDESVNMKVNLNNLFFKLKNAGDNYIEYYEGMKKCKKSFGELYNDVEKMMCYISSLGLKKNDRVIICAESGYNWILADLTCLFIGIYTIPLDKSKLADIESLKVFYNASYVFTNGLDEKRDDFIDIREIDLTASGNNVPEPVKYNDDDYFTTTFTSGTMGTPKSIPVKVKYFTHQFTNASNMFDIKNDDCILIFLPLNIYLERCYIYLAILMGFNVFLTPTSLVLKALKGGNTTFMVGVPYFFEQLHDLFMLQVKNKFGLKVKFILFSLKKKFFPHMTEKSVFKPFRDFYGGKLKFLLSGSSKCKNDILRFYQCMGVPLYEGYGISEIANMVALNCPGACKIGSVGKVYPGVSLKFDDENQMIIKSDNARMIGYINVSDEENAKFFLEDGWVATGDIGHIDDEGYVFIDGRKNDLIAISNGKKIYPAYIEDKINDYPAISSSMVIGGDSYPYLSAVISLKYSVPDADIQKHIDSVNESLEQDERIKKFIAVNEKFDTENGMLTPAFKLNRKVIEKHFSKEIKNLYSK